MLDELSFNSIGLKNHNVIQQPNSTMEYNKEDTMKKQPSTKTKMQTAKSQKASAKTGASFDKRGLQAIVKAKQKEGDDEGKLVLGFDNTFNVPIVYAYSNFESYQALYASLFGSDNLPDPAKGYCTTGRGRGKISDYNVVLVWVNNMIKLELTLPIMIHEIVHLATSILDMAGVEDKSGEAMAYIAERETRRVLSELYHLPVEKEPTNRVTEVIKEFCNLEPDNPKRQRPAA